MKASAVAACEENTADSKKLRMGEDGSEKSAFRPTLGKVQRAAPAACLPRFGKGVSV
jgi:hypothetical protein